MQPIKIPFQKLANQDFLGTIQFQEEKKEEYCFYIEKKCIRFIYQINSKDHKGNS